jgi:hypothetical protein
MVVTPVEPNLKSQPRQILSLTHAPCERRGWDYVDTHRKRSSEIVIVQQFVEAPQIYQATLCTWQEQRALLATHSRLLEQVQSVQH